MPTTASAPRGPRDEKGVLADQVLAAARSLFASRGYASTSLRMVADTAGVNVALVSYYFGSKSGLLDAAMRVPDEFVALVAESLKTPVHELGAVIIRTALGAWDDEAQGAILGSIVLSAAHEPLAMDRLRATITGTFIAAVAADLPEQEREVRAGLVASQIVGMFMTRYIWRVGALADLSSARVAALLGPTIQHYLDGDLPVADGPLE